MKKRNIVLLIILAVLLVAFVILGIWVHKNWNTVSTLYYVVTNQGEKLNQKTLDTEQKALETIKDYGIENIRPLNEEETQRLNSGELSEEEAIKIVLGQSAEDNENEQKNISSGQTESQQPSKYDSVDAEMKAKNDEIAQLVGKMYVLKAKFTGELKVIKEWVLDEYVRLPKEQRTASLKAKIGKEAYAKAAVLEADCDAQVSEILQRMTVLLEETGQSTSIVEEIQTAYENEKMSTKSYYLSRIDEV